MRVANKINQSRCARQRDDSTRRCTLIIELAVSNHYEQVSRQILDLDNSLSLDST